MNKYIKKIKELLMKYKAFGFKITFFELLDMIFKKTYLNHYIHKTKHEVIKKYLKREYRYYINNFRYQKREEKIKNNDTIWIFWWQGLESTPELVKKCIKSIIKNKKEHSVIIIDQNNYTKYTNIPNYIIEKVNSGKISITLFSDIIRMDLLYSQGGIYMDATLFMSKEFDNNMYNYSLYSVKHNLYSDWHICKGKWSGFFWASNKNNSSIQFFRNFFFEYFKNKNISVTYFLIDCIISIGYEEIPEIKKEIDNIPINSTEIFELSNCMIKNDIKSYEKCIENCNLHKLSYKIDYKKENKMNKSTYELFLES